MKNDLYNSKDEEYKHVIKLLKELPKEKAPENFEYNLSIKIKNENFEPNLPESSKFNPWTIFLPASGAVAALLLVFVIAFNNQDPSENPFQMQPKLRNEMGANVFASSENEVNFGNNSKISDTDVIIKESESILEEEKSPLVRKEPEGKKIVSNAPKVDFPFDDYNSTNLDQVLGEKRKATNISRRATLAGRSNSPAFNGFFIREEVDKEYVEAMKAKMDSLKKEIRKKKTKMAQ